MKLNYRQLRTLLALRAGPMTSGQLLERFGKGHLANSLLTKGLLSMRDAITYQITQLGREHCPTRREGLINRMGRPPKTKNERKQHATNP